MEFKFNPFTKKLDLVDVSVLTGYVPYTGATANLDLGAFGLIASSVSVNADTDTVGGITASRAKMGTPTGGASDSAYFGHVDMFGAGDNYAVTQSASGVTYLSGENNTNVTVYARGNGYARLQTAQGNASVTDSGSFKIIDGSDTLEFTGDGTDWYQKWSDGSLYLQTDEGTDFNSIVTVKGKGAGYGQINLQMGNSATQETWIIQDSAVFKIGFDSSVTGCQINAYSGDVDTVIKGDTRDVLTVDAGTDKLYVDNGASNERLLGKRVFSIPVTNPAGTEDFLVYRVPWDITITAVNGCCMDGTSLTCQINECDANGDNAVQICNDTAVTTSNTALTITNASVDAGDYISFTSSAMSGTVTKMMLSVEYTID